MTQPPDDDARFTAVFAAGPAPPATPPTAKYPSSVALARGARLNNWFENCGLSSVAARSLRFESLRVNPTASQFNGESTVLLPKEVPDPMPAAIL